MNLHKGNGVIWAVGGKEQGVEGRTAQNEVKCPQKGSAKWSLKPQEVSMWFMARS